jgi:hypothetical protein
MRSRLSRSLATLRIYVCAKCGRTAFSPERLSSIPAADVESFLTYRLNFSDPTRVEAFMKMTISRILTVGFALALRVLSAAQAQPSEAQLMKEANVTKSQAEKIALARVPGGIIKSAELEKEHGILIWSFDIAKAGTKNITEVQVDAKTGKIASVQTETPKDQAKEASADKR